VIDWIEKLLCALVNFLQKDAEDRPVEYSTPAGACHLRYGISERIDACICISLVLGALRVYADIAEDLLDPCLRLGVLATVGVIGDRALGRGSAGERSIDASGAFVVQYVCADLTNLFWCSSVVEVVILDLEVLAEGKEDVECKLIVVGIGLVLLLHGESTKEQCERDR
jgi:hypothetical protein